MPLTKEKKAEILTELKDWLKNSKIIIFVNFHGLTTELSSKLRALMREADAKYLVAKKTLIKKSLGEFKFSGQMPQLTGEVGLVLGSGEVSPPAKSLVKFGKEHKEQISILGGVFENGFMEADFISRIASLPTKEVLLGQLIYIINAPMRQMVGVLRAPMRDFISVLTQIKK